MPKTVLLVSEYYDTYDPKYHADPDIGRYHIACENVQISEYLIKKEVDFFYVDPLHSRFDQDGNIDALNYYSKKVETINIDKVDVLHFLTMCKKIYQFHRDDWLTANLKEVCEFIQSFQPHEHEVDRVINSTDTIIKNISKQYIFDLQEKGLNIFTPTKNITDFDQLKDYCLAKDGKVWVLKPKISERGILARVLTESCDLEEIKDEYYDILYPEVDDGCEVYRQIMKRQGLIVQEFQNGFLDPGEIKASLIDGKYYCSRLVKPDKKKCEIAVLVAPTYPYDLKEREKDFIEEIIEPIEDHFGAHATRIDFIENGQGGYYVSEIEAVNQSFEMRKLGLFKPGQKDAVHQAMLHV